jgi:hypothetical protein
MNQRPQGLNFSKAIIGFLRHKSAEEMAPITVTGYERDLKVLIEYHGDLNIFEINLQHILSFLNFMRTDYVPRRIKGDNSRMHRPEHAVH